MTSLREFVTWTEQESGPRRALWWSESGFPAPKRVVTANDRLAAGVAHRMASEGTGILWQGDFQNARQLLSAIGRRIDRKHQKRREGEQSSATAFYQHRQRRAQRARVLGLLLVPFEAGCVVALRRAPDVRLPCVEAGCPEDEPFVLSLRELLGIIGAHEWRKNGVEIPALGARIHPRYGVFSPVRREYVDLVADAPLPSSELAYDVGTGTGVLAAVLAHRGVRSVVATDQDARALSCAQENITRLGLDDRVDVVEADLFPADGRAPLVVCNPPWIPAKPTSALEQGIYDPGSRMLRGFLTRLAEHLDPDGEGWLLLSDLAEHLGLRSRTELLRWFDESGLDIAGRQDIKPRHPRTSISTDPLHAARASEITSLWRLTVR